MEKDISNDCVKPVALEKIDYTIWGTGNPGWGDPREGFQRMFSNHVVWLCRKKPMSALEIAKELNVPTLYVEQELEILACGANGEYGMLRRLDGGRYTVNFVLLDKDEIEQAQGIYEEQLPKLADVIARFIEEHREEYLAFPYLNHKVDMNLILWQQVFMIAQSFDRRVEAIMREKHFAGVTEPDRPFSIFGCVYNGKNWGAGCDGIGAENVCGFSKVTMANIYITRIKAHFHCESNISNDPQLQLALRAIDGLNVSALSEEEKEHAAKAVECGYLYREGDMLYTKILACTIEDGDRLFAITNAIRDGYFEEDAQAVAEKMAALLRRALPDYLLGEWRFANKLSAGPLIDLVVEALIERGLLIPPKDGIGAEGCWMCVKK